MTMAELNISILWAELKKYINAKGGVEVNRSNV